MQRRKHNDECDTGVIRPQDLSIEAEVVAEEGSHQGYVLGRGDSAGFHRAESNGRRLLRNPGEETNGKVAKELFFIYGVVIAANLV